MGPAAFSFGRGPDSYGAVVVVTSSATMVVGARSPATVG